MMENSQITADIGRKMHEMQDEISKLKSQLEAKEKEIADKAPDLKCMFEEGFAKLHEAVKPLVDKANIKIGEPTKEAVARMEEKISIHPFAAVMIALGAGLIVGKLLDGSTHYRTVKSDD